MYKVGQLFMFNVDGIRAIWALVDVNLEKDEYTIECVENCALKGMRKTGSKTKFDKTVTTELPRIIPADEQMEMLNQYNSSRLEQMINNIRMSLRLHIQKHNKPYCHDAEGFIHAVMAYSHLIIPEKVKQFELVLRKYVYGLVELPEKLDERELRGRTFEQFEELDNLSVVNALFQYIDTCKILKTWNDTHSWEEIDKVLHKQGHSGFSFSGVANMMINYSDIGVEFIDRYCLKRVEHDADFAEIYNKAKARIQSQQLNQEDVLGE